MKHRRCGMKQSLFRLHVFCLESRQKKWRRGRHPSPCSSFNLFYAQSPWLSEVHSRIFPKIYTFLKPDKKGSFWYFLSAEWYWNGTFLFSVFGRHIHWVFHPPHWLPQIISLNAFTVLLPPGNRSSRHPVWLRCLHLIYPDFVKNASWNA